MAEELNNEVEAVEQPVQKEEATPVSFDDGIIKVDMSSLNNQEEQEQPLQETQEAEQPVAETVTEVVEETTTKEPQPETVVEEQPSVLEEVTDQPETVAEVVENLEEQVDKAIDEKMNSNVELPENVQKVVDFINETNGTLEDYVKLNQDYSQLNESQLLREYYENTKPHLDREDIDFLMEDNFSFDEDIDDERDIRRKKLAKREELAKAKNHLNGLKEKYYDQIKGGSRLNPEQKEAIDFFNRYKKENEEATTVAKKVSSIFNDKTEKLFSDEFKGFDFNVGEKKFRFKVNNVDTVKNTQSDLNNFIKKFLNDKNEMEDAAGYHKSLYTAMNADSIANHFYEQGKADAIKSSVRNAKNIDMNPRGTHEDVRASNGWKVRAVSTNQSSSKLKIKSRK